jgi:alkylmercury lyase
MANTRVIENFRQLTQDGGLLDYGPERSRLLVRVQRALAAGRPVTNDQVTRFAAAAGIAPDDADAFLRTVTERDEDDRIVGAFALSLNEHPHRFIVDGTRLSAWCAGDTLFLPAVLDRTADVESTSPVSGQPIRLRVSPSGVEEVSPASTVVSMVVVDPEPSQVSSVEAIWGTYCHQIFFFASREEAEEWAVGRPNIEIMSVAEVQELAQMMAARLLGYAA